jgi:hypothetical protein
LLDPCYCVLTERLHSKDKNDIETNWSDIKDDLVNLINYRLSTSECYWYNQANLETLSIVERFAPVECDSVNFLPQGILAEVFFQNACIQNGIKCEPCFGSEDVEGMDFIISNGLGEKYIDVSINFSNRSIRRKVKRGTTPTLFLPWTYKSATNGRPTMSYAYEYLRSGAFDGKGFLTRALDLNINLLEYIRADMLNNGNGKKIKGKKDSGFSCSDKEYIYDMEGVLYLIRANI